SVDLLSSKSPRSSSIDSPTRITYGSSTRTSFGSPPRSKLESSEIISSIDEANESSRVIEVISINSLISTSEPQSVDTQKNSNADGLSAGSNVTNKKSGEECGSPVSPTKALHVIEGETRASIIGQLYTQEKPSAASPIIENKEINEIMSENSLGVGITTENEGPTIEEENSEIQDSPKEESNMKELSKEKEKAPLLRPKPKALKSDPLPTNNELSDSSLIDEYEKVPKHLTDPVVKEVEETEEKDGLQKTPGRINVKDFFKEKGDTQPPRPKPEPPRKKTSLLTAMFEDADKKHGSEGSTKSLFNKNVNSVVQATTTTVVETVAKVSEEGAETTKLEVEKTNIAITVGDIENEKPEIDVHKKGDLPKTSGRLNVKEFVKARKGKESKPSTPLKSEPQRKKISLVGTVFEDLQKKNESNLDKSSKSPIALTGKKIDDNHSSTTITTTTTATVSNVSTVLASKNPGEENLKGKGVTDTLDTKKSQINTSGSESAAKPQVNKKVVLDRLPWMTQKSDDTKPTSANPSKGPVPRKLASSFLTSASTTSTTAEQSKPRVPSKLDGSISQRLEGVFGGKVPLPGMGRGTMGLGGRKVSLSGEESSDVGRVKVMIGARDETGSKDGKDETSKSEEVTSTPSTSLKPLNHVTKERPRPPGRSRPPTRPTKTVSNEDKENKKMDLTESKDEKVAEYVGDTDCESTEKTNEQTLETIKIKETSEETSVGETSKKVDGKD
ncbi:8409_t:CDS:2, partial [Acaulospora morrowiae]